MSKGPSKLLYTAGGWFLGGLVGGLIGAAVVMGIAAIGAPVSVVAGVYVAAQIAALGASIIGAVKGWKAASRAQHQYVAPEQAAPQRPSRSAEMGMSQQLAAETGIDQGNKKNWTASIDSERAAQAMAVAQR